jgi:hypothetical protein
MCICNENFSYHGNARQERRNCVCYQRFPANYSSKCFTIGCSPKCSHSVKLDKRCTLLNVQLSTLKKRESGKALNYTVFNDVVVGEFSFCISLIK